MMLVLRLTCLHPPTESRWLVPTTSVLYPFFCASSVMCATLSSYCRCLLQSVNSHKPQTRNSIYFRLSTPCHSFFFPWQLLVIASFLLSKPLAIISISPLNFLLQCLIFPFHFVPLYLIFASRLLAIVFFSPLLAVAFCFCRPAPYTVTSKH